MNQRLFVYGSLRSGLHHPVFSFISRYFRMLGNARVKGKLYYLGEYPGAMPVEEELFITGELYEANSKDAFNYAIEQLDDYEGIHVDEEETPLFRREEATVYIQNEKTNAWIYWYNRNVEGATCIETGDYLEWVAK